MNIPKNNLWREFLLGWRLMRQYIVRGRKWTLALTTLLVAVAFINLAFASSLLTGITHAIEHQVKSLMVGEIYLDAKEPGKFIANADEKVAAIKRIDGVRMADKVLSFDTLLVSGDAYTRAAVNVVDPKTFGETLDIEKHIESGAFLKNDDEIVLGSRLLVRTALDGAKVGDTISMKINGKDIKVKVGGISNTKYIYADDAAYVSCALWQKISGEANSTAATMIIVRAANGKDNEIKKALENLKYPDVRIHDWRDAASYMDTISGSFISLDAIMLLVGIIIAAVTIFIVIYVDIINKRRQIGIQRAIGVKPRVIVFSYVLLSLFYAVCGVAAGLAIFFGGLVPFFLAHPFRLPIADVTLYVSPPQLVFRAEIVLVVAIISGAIPAVMASRMKMLDAILGRG
ncbi:MAG: ABC transporter permease [Candidatus Saccharimonas sp.]